MQEKELFSSRFKPDYWRNVYQSKVFPDEFWNALSSSGMIGFLVSKHMGGFGRNISDFCTSVAKVARYYAGMGSYLFLSSALSSLAFERLGQEWMKSEILPNLITGKEKVCVALTEEASGLDANSIRTLAVRKGDYFEITGSKMFVTNFDQCRYVLLFANTDKGKTVFVVDKEKHIINHEELRKAGLDFIKLFRINVDSIEVNKEYILGTEGNGLKEMRHIFMIDRLATASSLVGTGFLALDTAASYAKSRVVFNKSIGSNQGIQFALADSACRLLATDCIIDEASRLLECKDESYVNIALLQAMVSSSLATDKALQAHGGHGYLEDYDVVRYWRDVRAYKVHPLSEEIVLASIASSCLGLPRTY